MSLKDLLPEGALEAIREEAGIRESKPAVRSDAKRLIVRCPECGKEVIYDASNPFRPFCSERCKIKDLGAWASEERTIAGRDVNMDEDADLLNDPNLPKRRTGEGGI